jgi:diguanylate cyclase (GGDEF)-like protein
VASPGASLRYGPGGTVVQSNRPITWKSALDGARDVPDDIASDLATDRRRRFLSHAPLAAAYALFATLILAILFWGKPAMGLVAIWSIANALVLAIRIYEGREVNAQTDPEGLDRSIRRHTLITGGVWGVLIAALYLGGGPEHDAVLSALVASVLCVGAFQHSSYPGAALGYSLLVAAGAIVGVNLDVQPNAFEFSLLLLGCVLAIHRSAAISAAGAVRRRLSEAALRESEATVRLLLRDFETSASDWLWRTDSDQRLVDVSARFAEAARTTPEALAGAHLLALADTDETPELADLLRDRKSFRDVSLRVLVAGEERWWLMSGQPKPDGGYRGVCSDITDRRRAEARVAYYQDFDPLTELPNRSMLVRNLAAARVEAQDSGDSFGLMCIDIDNFKSINDTMGHAVGDAYLKIMARRISDACGPDVVVARLGGDEFAVLKRHASADDMQDLSDVLVDAMLAPVNVGGRPILASGSIGVAMGSGAEESMGDLMQQAELALYQAKAQGRGVACFFEPSMDEDARWQANLEADLRTALSRQAMDVFFQPMVDPRTRRVAAYETLMRWNRPGHGLVSPADFIASAEETGLIIPLGEWVIRRAVEEASLWVDPVSVSVNLSPAQMRNASIVPTVAQALASHQFNPARLQIEITETVLMEETEQTLRTLHSLRELGVKIALDDFGTGYSSLSYLRAFPFDKIKIDQRFVRDIQASPANQAIVRSVIGLARDLGMDVTAEGVENEQQAAMLAGFGCMEVQGFLYSRPLPSGDIAKRPVTAFKPGSPVAGLQRRMRAP